jgi:cytidylate kinase
MRKIITICREFGSGGREVGKRLAEILQIPYYDNEIVTQLAERTQLAVSYVSQFSEKGLKSIDYFPITTGRSFHRQMQMNPKALQNINLRIEQGRLLRELAEKSDCVIVGRCANHILSDFDPLRVFIYAEMDAKIKRCREKAPEHEQMTDKELIKHINGIDKTRADYYKSVTGRQWGDRGDYDMMINSTHYPIKLIAKILAQISGGEY